MALLWNLHVGTHEQWSEGSAARMVLDLLELFSDLPAFGSSPRYPGDRRNLLAKWTLGLAFGGIITLGLTSLASLVTGIIALVQIFAFRQRGVGTAITGMIIGLIVTAVWAFIIIAVVSGIMRS